MDIDVNLFHDDQNSGRNMSTKDNHERTILPNRMFIAPYNYADRDSWVPYFMCRMSHNRKRMVHIESSKIILPNTGEKEKTYVFICISRLGGLNAYHVYHHADVMRHVVELSEDIKGAYMFSCKGILKGAVLPSCIDFDNVVTLLKFESILSSFECIQRSFLDKERIIRRVKNMLLSYQCVNSSEDKKKLEFYIDDECDVLEKLVKLFVHESWDTAIRVWFSGRSGNIPLETIQQYLFDDPIYNIESETFFPQKIIHSYRYSIDTNEKNFILNLVRDRLRFMLPELFEMETKRNVYSEKAPERVSHAHKRRPGKAVNQSATKKSRLSAEKTFDNNLHKNL